MISVELYGIARLRAGTPRFELEAGDVGEALRGLCRLVPQLEGSVIAGSSVHPAYRLNINGERFVSDPATPLVAGDVLLLLTADVGG